MHARFATMLLATVGLITTAFAAATPSVVVECGAVAPWNTCVQGCPGTCKQTSSHVWCDCPWQQGGGGA
ncbi:hypothetical protein AG0111_0g6490 [Alternaria gaisen]|uniref:Uncharacterized protein n=1 Tax=Alternaria gaisen TaxID=167740 RepID=A0ACB6FJX4_9PLEO|nr:hypothetical protein AG0111_0g6490 [Alternaria gaisen]